MSHGNFPVRTDPRFFYLSDHFTLAEGIKSQTAEREGIDNNPPEWVVGNMIRVADVMEKIRTLLGHPISVSSWYRSPALNTKIGGAKNSAHISGAAVDFDCDRYGPPLDICKTILKNQRAIQFDQLILEHTWVHLGLNPNPNIPPRNQVLSLLKTGGYSTGLTDKFGIPYPLL